MVDVRHGAPCWCVFWCVQGSAVPCVCGAIPTIWGICFGTYHDMDGVCLALIHTNIIPVHTYCCTYICTCSDLMGRWSRTCLNCCVHIYKYDTPEYLFTKTSAYPPPPGRGSRTIPVHMERTRNPAQLCDWWQQRFPFEVLMLEKRCVSDVKIQKSSEKKWNTPEYTCTQPLP